MLRLLQIEFHKMRFSRATKVLLIIYFSLFFSIILFASIRFKFGNIDFQLADQGIFNFPYIWHFNTYFAAILKIFLALVIVSMISVEYSNRTLKQNLIDGLSKKEFVLSKFYMILAFSVASTLLIFLVSLGLGLIFSDFNEVGIIFSRMEYLGGYFLKLMGFFSFCFFLGVLIKRSAFAIGALFVWWIVESIIKGIMMVQVQKNEITDWLTPFLPLESMGNLVKEPLTKLGIVKSSFNVVKDSNIYWYQILIVLVWTAVFIWGSYVLIKKRDL
ncbi:MAG TPA: ABC transporter permease [Flavobacteriaceae bacterium]|nr:ABC transporter permease [Flavobacteriaceae bacterium]